MPPMKWPPQIKDIHVYGEIKDNSVNNYPRDIGRPVYLGGNTYYVFGDTFCFNHAREFVGLSNNTAALVPAPADDPLKSQYRPFSTNSVHSSGGGGHYNPYQNSFIPHTQSEDEYENDPHNKKENNRIVNWSFGGIVEDRPGDSSSKEGWVFFEKMYTHGGTAGKYFGMGVARVAVQPDQSLKVTRVMGDNILFGEEEPKFGTITHYHGEDGYVYILGPKDAPAPTLDLKNHWARIRHDLDFTDRSNYEFLLTDGQNDSWSKTYRLDQLKIILPAHAQGAIVKVPELAPPGRPYMWFGVNKFGGNHLYIACAPELGGPWEEWGGPEIPKYGGGGLRYCLYPHHRTSRTGDGEMIISWSDDGKQMGGMVVLAKVKFVVEGETATPATNVGGGGVHTSGEGGGNAMMDKAKGFLNKLMH